MNVLVQSIERWKESMTEEVAIKVRQQTGCVLFRTRKDNPRPDQEILAFGLEDEADEHKYTKADFDEHQQRMREFTELGFEEHALAAARCINFLIYAAAQRSGGHVLSICNDLERFVIDACDGYKLQPYVEAIVRCKTLRYVGDGDPTGDIKSFAKAPLSVGTSFLLPTERPYDQNEE